MTPTKDQVERIAQEIATQDNAFTSHPYFVVFEGGADKPREKWVFRHAFLTRAAAEGYIAGKRHDLRKPFVWVVSAHDNHEIRSARAAFPEVLRLLADLDAAEAERERFRSDVWLVRPDEDGNGGEKWRAFAADRDMAASTAERERDEAKKLVANYELFPELAAGDTNRRDEQRAAYNGLRWVLGLLAGLDDGRDDSLARTFRPVVEKLRRERDEARDARDAAVGDIIEIGHALGLPPDATPTQIAKKAREAMAELARLRGRVADLTSPLALARTWRRMATPTECGQTWEQYAQELEAELARLREPDEAAVERAAIQLRELVTHATGQTWDIAYETTRTYYWESAKAVLAAAKGGDK